MIPSKKNCYLFLSCSKTVLSNHAKKMPPNQAQFFSYVYYWKLDYPLILKGDIQSDKNYCGDISIVQLQLKSYKLEILTELRPLTTKTFWLVLLSGFCQIYLANHPNRIAKNERFFYQKTSVANYQISAKSQAWNSTTLATLVRFCTYICIWKIFKL